MTGRPGHTVSTDVLEYCLVILLMVLLSPQSSKPHFCTLILPGFCLTRIALARRDPVLAVILTAAALCAQLSNKDLWGVAVYDAVMWYGSVFWTAALLFLGCARARWTVGAVQANAGRPASTLPAVSQAA